MTTEKYKLSERIKLAVFLQINTAPELVRIAALLLNAGAQRLGPKAFTFTSKSDVEIENLQGLIERLSEGDSVYIVAAQQDEINVHLLTPPRQGGGIRVV